MRYAGQGPARLRPAGRAILAGLAAGLVMAGCSGRGAPASSGAPASGPAVSGAASGTAAGAGDGETALAWRACPSVAPGLQCASLQVPLSYARPGGRKITLALSRMPATAPARRGRACCWSTPAVPAVRAAPSPSRSPPG